MASIREVNMGFFREKGQDYVRITLFSTNGKRLRLLDAPINQRSFVRRLINEITKEPEE